MQAASRLFCAAPMMQYSHAPARRLWQFLYPSTWLYTEMIMCEAIIRRRPLSAFAARTALQLGGRDAARLAQAAQIGEDNNAAEINLNCGCPSPKVQQGAFGACLMKTPAIVGNAVAALKKNVNIPVTVKCRIAVDDMPDNALDIFVRAVIENGADALILHARRAWLDGLSPAQNRAIPPLDYERAMILKDTYGDFPIIINGGIDSVESIRRHLRYFDGVMIGRAIIRQPYLFANAAAAFFNHRMPSPSETLTWAINDALCHPPREWRQMASTLTGLFYGIPNSKKYRQALAMPLPQALPILRQYCYP